LRGRVDLGRSDGTGLVPLAMLLAMQGGSWLCKRGN
jgi:hypothetical protein